MKWSLSAAAIFMGLLACSCKEDKLPEPPRIAVTDTKPVGDGLKVLGYAFLGAAVVITVGRVVR